MELGEGIFFGLALVALVILYVNTIDRWNWGGPFAWFRGLFVRWKRPLKWIVSIALVALIGLAGYSYWLENRPYTPDYPDPIYMTSFWNLELGATKSDVLFEKGEPDAKFVSEDGENELWAYAGYKSRTHSINFTADRLTQISIEDPCEGKEEPIYPSIDMYQQVQGVILCNPKWVLLEHVGEPEHIVDINGGLRREYIYRDTLNVSYVLERGLVISMSVGRMQ